MPTCEMFQRKSGYEMSITVKQIAGLDKRKQVEVLLAHTHRRFVSKRISFGTGLKSHCSAGELARFLIL